MHTGGTAHLGHPADRFLHLFGGHQHQVRQLVDDHHHGGQLLHLGVAFAQGIEARQILDTPLGEHLIPLHHLIYGPLQRTGGLLGIGDHRDQKMGNAVIGRQLHHFGIHHDKAHLIRRGFIQQTDDQRVGANGFTGAGGAGDQHMGQAGDVADDAVAPDVLAHGKGHGTGVGGELSGLDHVPDPHGRYRLVGHLNAHGGDLAGNGRDTHTGGAQRQRNIVAEVGQLAELDALIQCKLISGHGGAVDHLTGVGVHAEGGQGSRQTLGIQPQLRAHLLMAIVGVLVQQRDGRIAIRFLTLRQFLFNGLADLGGGALHLCPDDLLPLFLRHRLLGGSRCGTCFRIGWVFCRSLRQRGIQHLCRRLDVTGTAGKQAGRGRLQHSRLPAGFGVRFGVQRNIDRGPLFPCLLGNGLCLYSFDRYFVLVIIFLIVPLGALLSPASHLLDQLRRFDLQGRQHSDQRQQNGEDQGYHTAEQRLRPHCQGAGDRTAAQQFLSVLPQRLDAFQRKGIVPAAQQQMQHHAQQYRQQQRTEGAQFHGAAPVVEQRDPGVQQRGSRQPVAIPEASLQRRGQKRQQNGIHIKISHQNTQRQQQAHNAADDTGLCVIGRRRRRGTALGRAFSFGIAAPRGSSGGFFLGCIGHDLPHLMALSSSVSSPTAQQ